jgi:DNA polymerase-3 subunit gamma/tau
MLLKGITEVSYAGQPLLAAEMVLIRLAHAADVPSGEDLLKLARQNPPPEKSSPIVMAQPLKRDQPIAETVGSLATKPELSAAQAPAGLAPSPPSPYHRPRR